MKRTPEHIDDLFRERLYDAAPAPPAFVWENVERELRKRRRRLLFWIFSFGIAGAGIAGFWLANTTKQQQTASNMQTRVEMAPAQPIEDATATKTPSIEPQIIRISEKTKVGNSSLVIAKQIKISLGEQQSPKQINTQIATQTANTTAPSLNSTFEQSTETTPATLEAKPQKTFFEGKNGGAGFSFAMLPLQLQSQIVPGVSAPQTADLLHKSWPNALHSRPVKPGAKKPVKNCYDFAKQPSAWILEGYFGPSLAQRELITSPDNRPYLNKRLSTEKRALAFNAGVRASLMLKGNFLIRAGLHYDQMTEIFEYIDPEFVRTLVANVYHPNTGLTTLDTVGVEYGEKYQKTFNRFGMLDIPLMAGVELRKGRSGFNINAGMSFNVLFWKRGAILSPITNEPAWFTPGKTDAMNVFRPRTGLSATASVQWFYHVKPRLRVFVEPYFKKVLRPVTVGSHPVEQRYGIGGLRFGFAKILN